MEFSDGCVAAEAEVNGFFLFTYAKHGMVLKLDSSVREKNNNYCIEKKFRLSNYVSENVAVLFNEKTGFFFTGFDLEIM